MKFFHGIPTEERFSINNQYLKSKDLSLDAKGLLSQILSIPGGRNTPLSSLSQFNQEPVEKIQAVLFELENSGYLIKDIDHSTGKIVYIVYKQLI